MYFYIASILLLTLFVIVFKIVSYYIVLKRPKVVIMSLILIGLMPTILYISTTYIIPRFHKINVGKDEIVYKSNTKSQYSQIWLDYLSYRDQEIGRLGSVDKFHAFLKSKDFTERTYATQVIRDMLLEQGIDDESIAEKCVEENIVGSLE